jgi:hypothetical protein
MPVPTVPRFEDPAFAVDAQDPSRAPQWGVSPKLNFDAPDGQLLMFNNAGEFILTNPATDLEQLVVKAMITDRLRYSAYDKEFGSDFWVMLGRGLSDLSIQSVAERYVRETLGNIDLIRAVDQVSTQIRGDTLYLSFRIVVISGYEKEFSFARVIK